MVEIYNLKKAFNSHIVLDDVSLKVDKGENLVVFGRSGTGKSVLLKCMVRLMEPDSGKIIIDNKDVLSMDIKELNNLRKQIGFLFQSAALYDSMSVRQNLEFPLIRHFNFTPEEREQKIIKEAIEKKNVEWETLYLE